MSDHVDGLVISAQSGFFTVHTDLGDFTCQTRGRLKQKRRDTDLIAAGDRVRISLSKEGTGMVEEVAKRERSLARLSSPSHGFGERRWDRDGYLSEREQVIVANPDQVVFVLACAEPAPHLRMVDRLLVGAEYQHIPAVVCANKVDLIGRDAAKSLFGVYGEIGYLVLYSSAVTGEGLERLREVLKGRISALMGPSGAGKTSLLNAIQPGLGLRVREVSQATTKGRHTTVSTRLVPLDAGGWVADTPGVRALALFDLDPEELDAYFPDIAPHVSRCQFSDCAHTVEPGCAVVAAVAEGAVRQHRYECYVRLRQEHQRLADMYWWGIQ